MWILKLFNIISIISIIHLNNSNNRSYLSFNLQLYINSSNNFSNATNFIHYNLDSLYYTKIKFGTPEKTYIMQIKLDDYGFKITNYDCEIELQDKTVENIYNPFLSNSSIVEISGINFTYYWENQVYKITEYINLLSNNNIINNPKITFIYNPRNLTFAKKAKDFSPNTCFKLGLRLPEKYYEHYEDYEISLLGQFKRQKFINSYEWFIEYGSNDKDDSLLIIGISPHEYNNKKYIENNLRKISCYNRLFNDYYYWNFKFTQIFMRDKDNKREFMNMNTACFVPSLNVIKGTYEYQKIINESLFSELIINHKCFEEFSLLNNIIYCHNENKIKNYIKDKFLNIVFFNNDLEEEFVLTYEDLFVEKGNIFYFLIVFDYSSSINTWILGKPFLTKYFFSYDYNMKTISYYKKGKTINHLPKKKNNIWIIIIVIFGFLTICCILGFLFAKYFYDNNTEKAIELDDEYFFKENDKKAINY